jgi:hypothetical protein
MSGNVPKSTDYELLRNTPEDHLVNLNRALRYPSCAIPDVAFSDPKLGQSLAKQCDLVERSPVSGGLTGALLWGRVCRQAIYLEE